MGGAELGTTMSLFGRPDDRSIIGFTRTALKFTDIVLLFAMDQPHERKSLQDGRKFVVSHRDNSKVNLSAKIGDRNDFGLLHRNLPVQIKDHNVTRPRSFVKNFWQS